MQLLMFTKISKSLEKMNIQEMLRNNPITVEVLLNSLSTTFISTSQRTTFLNLLQHPFISLLFAV